MSQDININQLHINFELTNNLEGVKSKLNNRYGFHELNDCMKQILSLIGYKYLSQNAESNDTDIGYTLSEEFNYKNLLINKGDVKEILKKGIKEITQENDNIQAADVFYDLFDLMDFEKYPNNDEWLFFVELVEWLGYKTTATLGQIFNFITQYPERVRNNIYQPKPSEILANVLTLNKENVENLYDPYATNGSLMVTIGDKINVKNFFGQHNEFDKYVLAKLNLLVNNVNYKNIFIRQNDINNPNPWNEIKFDLCATIPPFARRGMQVIPDDERFKPFSPRRVLEFAYLLDMVYNMDDEGAIGLIVPQGALFRGGFERKIVKHLVDNHLFSTIIGLPRGLFDGTGIVTTLIMLDKKPKDGIFYLNIMDESIQGKKNTLKLDGLNEYVPILAEQKEVESTSSMATIDDIKENDYNLSINRYMKFEKVDEIDIGKTIENIKLLKNDLKELDVELNTKIRSLFNNLNE